MGEMLVMEVVRKVGRMNGKVKNFEDTVPS